jgi:hypothetical protein
MMKLSIPFTIDYMYEYFHISIVEDKDAPASTTPASYKSLASILAKRDLRLFEKKDHLDIITDT